MFVNEFWFFLLFANCKLQISIKIIEEEAESWNQLGPLVKTGSGFRKHTYKNYRIFFFFFNFGQTGFLASLHFFLLLYFCFKRYKQFTYTINLMTSEHVELDICTNQWSTSRCIVANGICLVVILIMSFSAFYYLILFLYKKFLLRIYWLSIYMLHTVLLVYVEPIVHTWYFIFKSNDTNLIVQLIQ